MATSTCSIHENQDKQGGPFSILRELVRKAFDEDFKIWGPHLFVVEPEITNLETMAMGRKIAKQYAGLESRYADIVNVINDLDRGLYLTFLSNLPEEEIRHHNCNCCRDFIRRFGALALMTETGQLVPAMWNGYIENCPDIYVDAVRAMYHEVARGKVVGVHMWADRMPWGTAEAGGWNHFSVDAPQPNHIRRDLQPHEAMALKKEDYGTLCRGLAEFDLETCKQALSILEADALYRGEKFVGPAKFLVDLHKMRDAVPGQRFKNNVIWRAVAAAPVGWATPRSGMIGTLLDDIKMGLPFEAIKTRFTAKMHPLEYQRAQAKPTEGNVKQAEKLFEKMGLASALERRYAKLEEVLKIWLPRFQEPQKANTGSIFGHLETKLKSQNNLPMSRRSQEMSKPTPITWEKFRKTVLPNAIKMEVRPVGLQSFCGILTAVHPDSKQLFQWDYDDSRNQFNWYFYHGGSPAYRWGLEEGEWVDVTGVTLLPNQWREDRNRLDHKGAVFILRGCHETQVEAAYLYSGTMRSDLHQVRSTIEAFNKTGRATGNLEGTACGIAMGGEGHDTPVRVTTENGTALYLIDRWD